MNKPTKFLALATALAGGLAVAPAGAQNTLHAPSDLVLTFQNPGGTVGASQTVTVALGNASTVFRDAAPGSFTLLNTANIAGLGLTLTNTFGPLWFEQPSLWMGAVGFRGTSPTATQLLDLDPHQTLYFTDFREGVGTIGEPNSPRPATIANSGDGITSAMGQVKGRIEAVAAGSSTAVFVEGVGSSFIDDQNPFTGGNPAFGQSTAYSNIAGGVQGQFGIGTFGVFGVGAAGEVEMVLDLYRLQNRNDVPGQYGFGEDLRQGEYIGSISINQAGQVGFTAIVPEPTTAALLGIAAIGLIGRRRNRSTFVS